MKSSSVALALSAIGLASAAPKLSKRQVNDGLILNYALTLEHLEDAFYRTGLSKFSEKDLCDAGLDKEFYSNLKEISFDEKTHVSFLTGALQAAGIKPVEQCTYNFGAAFSSPQAFVATASVLEGVGVSAYLGAAASIANKAYLTAAGSILTVEARHSSYIRSAGLGTSPFPQPFDDPLDFMEVYTLAAPFIKSCPKDNPSLGFKAFPALTLETSKVTSGGEIKLQSAKKLSEKDDLYACFITVTGPICSAVKVQRDSETVYTKVPKGVYGQSYVVLSKSKTVTDDTVVAGPAIVEVQGSAGGN